MKRKVQVSVTVFALLVFDVYLFTFHNGTSYERLENMLMVNLFVSALTIFLFILYSTLFHVGIIRVLRSSLFEIVNLIEGNDSIFLSNVKLPIKVIACYSVLLLFIAPFVHFLAS